MQWCGTSAAPRRRYLTNSAGEATPNDRSSHKHTTTITTTFKIVRMPAAIGM